MDQLLSAEARNRLANIKSVKPQKAASLEQVIIANAQRGMFQGKVSEDQLIDLLNQISAAEEAAATKVEVARHKFDEEDELDLDNLDL